MTVPRFFTLDEAAKRLGTLSNGKPLISPRTLRRFAQEGKLATYRPSNRYLVTEEDLKALLDQSKQQPKEDLSQCNAKSQDQSQSQLAFAGRTPAGAEKANGLLSTEVGRSLLASI